MAPTIRRSVTGRTAVLNICGASAMILPIVGTKGRLAISDLEDNMAIPEFIIPIKGTIP
jgi:hypothetical protein